MPSDCKGELTKNADVQTEDRLDRWAEARKMRNRALSAAPVLGYAMVRYYERESANLEKNIDAISEKNESFDETNG